MPQKMMRIVVDAALRIRDLNQRQHVDGRSTRRDGSILHAGDDLADLIAYGIDGIERGHRLLDRWRFPCANAFISSAGSGTMSRPCQRIARRRASGGIAMSFRTDSAGPSCRIRLADDANRLAAFDGEIDAIHRMHEPSSVAK